MSGERPIEVEVYSHDAHRAGYDVRAGQWRYFNTLAPGSLDEAKMRVAEAAIAVADARIAYTADRSGENSQRRWDASDLYDEAMTHYRALTKGETDGSPAPVSRESGSQGNESTKGE